MSAYEHVSSRNTLQLLADKDLKRRFLISTHTILKATLLSVKVLQNISRFKARHCLITVLIRKCAVIGPRKKPSVSADLCNCAEEGCVTGPREEAVCVTSPTTPHSDKRRVVKLSRLLATDHASIFSSILVRQKH